MAIPAGRNIVQKEVEKMLKYKSLCIETRGMWNLKYNNMPVMNGAAGIATRGLRKDFEATPGKHSVDSLQKTAILRISHIIRKVLPSETWSLRGGDQRWFKSSTRKKWPVTRDNNSNNNNNDIIIKIITATADTTSATTTSMTDVLILHLLTLDILTLDTFANWMGWSHSANITYSERVLWLR